jgi:zinc transport system ATP-binding protein
MTGSPLASHSAGGEPLVDCDDITVRLGDRPVLEKVSIVVQPGEIVTLIGPNGSGKTTLVRTILGLQTPQGGRIRRRPGLKIGYVPQRLSIDPILPLTVRRFLRLGGKHDEIVLQRAIDEVGGSDLMLRQIGQLSWPAPCSGSRTCWSWTNPFRASISLGSWPCSI